MDNSPFMEDCPEVTVLPYDDTVAYEEQLPPPSDSNLTPLAGRIGTTKVYLLSESSVARVGKRKHEDEEVNSAEEDVDMDEDTSCRNNALLLHGQPISHLPTARLFAYAAHFDIHPMGIEWIDDVTAVFVFSSKSAARTAWEELRKSASEDADGEGFVTARGIPITCWPPEERINKSLGKGEGLKGSIRMRWAKVDDVKKRGAKKESQFYRKHGMTAGKEVYPERGDGPTKRRRVGSDMDDSQQRAQLDDELDAFLAEGPVDEAPIEPPSPPSKMRSDYIGRDGRTLLERTSPLRFHPAPPPSRVVLPMPRRRNEKFRSDSNGTGERYPAGDEFEGRNGRYNGRRERVQKSQKELDDELDAFLHDRNQ